MGTGVGEAMLIGAAVGAGSGALGSAIQGGDVMQGALLGAGTGAIGGGIGGAFSGAGATAAGGASGVGAGGAGSAVSSLSPTVTGLAGSAPASTFGALSTAPTSGAFGALSAPTSGAAIGSLAAPTTSGISSLAVPTSSALTGTTAGGATSILPGNFTGFAPQLSNMALTTIGGTSALGAAMQAERDQYGMPSSSSYTGGPLNRFRYDPSTYRPDVVTPPNPVYRPSYADGGIATLMGRPSYPQSGIDRTQYATPSQMPTSAEVVASDYDTRVNPYSGEMMAKGGIADLGGYSDGGRMLKGPGDGMSDSIPGVIGGRQPARLADGEFVVPADVVSHLGNGSTDAGAKQLYSMMDKIRKARTGKKAQGKEINPRKYMPA
jgi:hypothetical protein